jgi:FtsZ-binding cell division protein ZapB
MTPEQALYRNTEAKHLAEIEELKEYVEELISAVAEIRAMKNALDKSNLALAQENKRLKEKIRLLQDGPVKGLNCE